jgi:hypothetical protein
MAGQAPEGAARLWPHHVRGGRAPFGGSRPVAWNSVVRVRAGEQLRDRPIQGVGYISGLGSQSRAARPCMKKRSEGTGKGVGRGQPFQAGQGQTFSRWAGGAINPGSPRCAIRYPSLHRDRRHRPASNFFHPAGLTVTARDVRSLRLIASRQVALMEIPSEAATIRDTNTRGESSDGRQPECCRHLPSPSARAGHSPVSRHP